MKKLLIPLALAVSVYHASASLPFYDPFADATANGGTTYTAGSALAAQQNNATNVWNEVNQSAGGAQPLIVSSNLPYAGLPQSLGNCVSFVPSGATANQGVRLNFWQTNQSGPSYYSFILKITDISQVPSTNANNLFCGFSDGSGAQPGAAVARIGSRILTKATNSGFVLGIGRNNTPSDYVFDTTVHNVGETLFIVASYELVLSNSTVIRTNVNLWINPSTNSFGTTNVPTPTVSAVNTTSTAGDINTNRVAGFCIVCQNSNAPSGLIDQVRISTTWVDATGGDPSILVPPSNATVPPGNTVHFTVTATGTPTLTYQWYQNGNQLSDGGNITGSGSTNLTLTGVVATNDGSYYVVVNNGIGGSAQSISATLIVVTDPIINTPPQDLTTNFGSTATFTVSAGGTSPFTYQWQKNGTNLTDVGNVLGSHSNTLVLSGVAYTDDGSYSVIVTNANHQSVSSTAADLAVNDPYIVTQPVSTNQGAGTTATFTVGAIGTGSNSFVYQWFKGANTFLFNNGNISGADTATLSIANISSTDQTNYFVTVSGAGGTATSSVVTLTVSTPASISIQPNPRTVVPGVNAAFVVSASGSAPLSYQWRLNGSNISGANSSAFVVTNAQPAVAGNYSVVVSNPFGSPQTSSNAALIVSNTLTLSSNNLIVIRVGDGSQTLSLNGNSMFLDQFDTNGNYINTVTIPDNGTNAIIAIGQDNVTGVNSGSTTGSCLSQSLDGRYMVIAGYNTNLGYSTNLASSTAAAIPRAVGMVESQGLYKMPVAATSSNLNGTTSRSAISDGTNNFWGGFDSGGTYYFGLDAASATIQTNMQNMRSMALFNGNIYGASALANQTGVLEVTGMPETFTNGTFLFSGSTGTFDMAVSPNGNLIYVADQRAIGGSGGGVLRYDFDGTNWNLTYTLQIGGQGQGTHGPRYVAADFRGANPVVYVTSNDGTFDNNRIIKVVDTGSGSTGTAVAFAGANQTFRGIRFGPTPDAVARPTLLYSRSGSNLILSWSGAFNLQSATNVTGTYTNIPSASSPYTNNMTTAPRMFFRLAQ